MHGLPITAAVSEVLSLLQLCLHQRTADTGVSVLIHPTAEPRTRDADLGGVTPLHHAVVSVAPFLLLRGKSRPLERRGPMAQTAPAWWC